MTCPDEGEATRASLWLRMAGGRLAVQYLERAGEWVADVDQGTVRDLEQIRQRLLVRLRRLEELSSSDTQDEEEREQVSPPSRP